MTTPMLAALRSRFPLAHIAVAVGAWAVPTLQNNPNVDEIIRFDAPWYNHDVPNRSIWAALRFVFFNDQLSFIRQEPFDLFIDVVGSHYGALLGLRARIPRRIGVRGYAGGHTGMTDCIVFSPDEQVARANLRFAELLGAIELPAARPQLFLTNEELAAAEKRWMELEGGSRLKRIVIGPGVGSPGRSWPIDWYAQLVERLTQSDDIQIILVGGKNDIEIGEQIARNNLRASNQCGKLPLRGTFAAVATADLVLCNASMLSHVAAAFSKPTLVLLGNSYFSVKKEAALWGHEGICQFLGREGPNTTIASVEDVYHAATKKLMQ